jgi:hypothetical protein
MLKKIETIFKTGSKAKAQNFQIQKCNLRQKKIIDFQFTYWKFIEDKSCTLFFFDFFCVFVIKLVELLITDTN